MERIKTSSLLSLLTYKSLISLNNTFWFSLNVSCMYFLRCMPKYFLVYDTILNDTVFLIIIASYAHSIYKCNYIFLYIHIIYCDVAKLVFDITVFLVWFGFLLILKIFYRPDYFFCKYSFPSLYFICIVFIFSTFLHWATRSRTMVSRNADSGQTCLVPYTNC